MFCALEIGKEREPEEATEADVNCPEMGGDEFEVDGGQEGPDADTRLGKNRD